MFSFSFLVPYGDVEEDPLHVHLVDDEDERLVPVGIQVARLDRRLLLLADAFALRGKRENSGISFLRNGKVKNERGCFPNFVSGKEWMD